MRNGIAQLFHTRNEKKNIQVFYQPGYVHSRFALLRRAMVTEKNWTVYGEGGCEPAVYAQQTFTLAT